MIKNAVLVGKAFFESLVVSKVEVLEFCEDLGINSTLEEIEISISSLVTLSFHPEIIFNIYGVIMQAIIRAMNVGGQARLLEKKGSNLLKGRAIKYLSNVLNKLFRTGDISFALSCNKTDNCSGYLIDAPKLGKSISE
jgi:hypothetical protein